MMQAKLTYNELVKKITELERQLSEYQNHKLIKEETKFAEDLKDIEWLLRPRERNHFLAEQTYGDLSSLNKSGLIKNSTTKKDLHDIVENFMSLLGTSCAIYEKNGDYAYGIFTSGWCKLLDEASFKLCETTNLQEALDSGKWLCHNSCWNQASKLAIFENKKVDIECAGGIRLYAVPIETSFGVIGSINFGYGTPPKDKETLELIAKKFKIDKEIASKKAKSYKTRPRFIIEIAKERIKKSASLIARLVEKKVLDEALGESEKKFRNAFNHSGIGMAIVGLNGNFIEVNDNFPKIFGYTKKEFSEKKILQITHPDDLEKSRIKIQELLANKYDSFHVEKKYLAKNGKIIWGELNASLVKDAENQPIYFIAQLQDITERKKAETRLRISESKYKKLIETAADAIYLINDKGIIIETNDIACKMLGRKKKEILQSTITDVDPNFSIRAFLSFWENTSLDEQRIFETTHKKEDGSLVPVEVSGKKFMIDNEVLFYGVARNISERKKAEQEIYEKEELYRALYQTAEVGIGYYTKDGKVVSFNEIGLQYLGKKEHELLGKTLDEIFPEEEAKIYWQRIQTLLKDGKSLSFIDEVELPSGSLWFKSIYSIVKDVTANVKGVQIASLDITELKQIEAELIQTKEMAELSENRLNKMFDNMKAGVAIYEVIDNGRDFRFVDFNKAAERITNSKKEEVIGNTLLNLFPNMDKAPLFKALQQVHITGQDLHLPPFYYTDAKREGWRENFVYKLPTGEIIALFEDVTKEQEYQQALIESENKFRTIYEMAGDMICIADIKTASFIDVNPSFSRILGYDKKELLNRPFLDFIHPDDVKSTIKVIEDELKKGKTVISFVNRYRTKNGNYKWLDWNSYPIPEKGITYAVAHDITEILNYQAELEKHKNNLEQLVEKRTHQLEKAMQELKEAQSQLIQSEKMASLGILTAGVAHEINNPLNYIQSSIYGLENMLKHGIDNAVLEKIIKNMKVGVERASSIVKSLNTFSRKGKTRRKLCNINKIIDECLLLLNHELKNKYTVTKNYTSEKYLLIGEEESLHQVFINLLINSIQAMNDEGEIVISTQLDKNKKQLQVKISDTGEGINKENISKIFDPFFTTKPPGKGVGLGLSIVYKIVREHNGTITLESEPSEGTVVNIILPIENMKYHDN
jgi:PAS domain S-box-containing protein